VKTNEKAYDRRKRMRDPRADEPSAEAEAEAEVEDSRAERQDQCREATAKATAQAAAVWERGSGERLVAEVTGWSSRSQEGQDSQHEGIVELWFGLRERARS
jgi:hypothetical protein